MIERRAYLHLFALGTDAGLLKGLIPPLTRPLPVMLPGDGFGLVGDFDTAQKSLLRSTARHVRR